MAGCMWSRTGSGAHCVGLPFQGTGETITMKNRTLSVTGICFAAAMAASPAMASFSAVITADNHYALYQEVGGVISLIGGNELGAAGAPGAYNWSLPEAHIIDTAATTIYIATWSDDAVAQGLLAEIDLGGGQYLRSGDAAWEVHCTLVNLGDGSPYPTAAEVAAEEIIADANNGWMAPAVYGPNGSVGPWGAIGGISSAAHWMWGNPDGVANAFEGGASHEEWQLFRIAVPQIPAPGVASAGLMLVGGLLRRRR